MTKAQFRAFKWLTGTWMTMDRSVSSAVESLCRYHKHLAETRFGPYGPRGGDCRQARLTEKGLALRFPAAKVVSDDRSR